MNLTRTTEQTIHGEVLGAFLTNPASVGGLGWLKGNANQVVADGLIRPESLYRFLKGGNHANQLAWADLVQVAGGEKAAEAAALAAAQETIESADTLVQLWRRGLIVEGLRFSLWNEAPGRGTLHSQRADFAKNEFITVAELPILGAACVPEPYALVRARGNEREMAKGKTAGIKDTATRRPDQAFYVNGILFSFLEVKARQTNQSATKEGRTKVAGDFRTFAFAALQQVRHEFELAEGREWPGFSAPRKRLSPAWQKKVINLMGAYAKTPWMAVMDMKELWLAPEPMEWLALCDRSLDEMLKKRFGEAMKQHPQPDMDKTLNARMVAGFARLPSINGALNPWENVKSHLEGLLSTRGVAREISLWHYPVSNKNKKDAVSKTLMRPRAPQRVAINQALSLVHTYYSHEHDPEWSDRDLREKLDRSLPALSQAQVDQIIEDRMKYRNGQDAYSVLIQGAAGLGKTHIAVCLGVSLFHMLAPLAPGAHPDTLAEALFDRIVILTDRVELRENIADEAERSGASRGQVLGVDDQDTLVAALTGAPLPKGKSGSILVVNLQKFPSLAAAIKAGAVKMKHTVGRTAFIIDEVHRSQSGDLNEAATDAFLNDLSSLSSGGKGVRKNLVIGLTATPTDTILARFGQWRPGVSASDQARWVPHFAYAMQQAIADGYVLDPMRGLYKLSIPLDILTTETLEGAGDARTAKIPSDVLYEHLGRQRVVADRFAEIFVGTTMLAMPHAHHTVRTGRGKAMITVPSIRAAITMAELIRDALQKLAADADGKPWASYAHIIKKVADERVFVLYSKPNTGQGKDLGECGRYNPTMGLGRHPTEKEIIDGFRCKPAGPDNEARNSIIIVVDKLLTGFDEPTLHTLLIARSMQGVALFQGMCRVNRVADGKTGCLVIDASHGDQVTNEAHRVFARYGNLSTSDLDGLDLLERIKERRKALLRWPGLKDAWKGKKPLTSGERAEDRNAWISELCRDPTRANELRRMVGGYLTDQRLAKNLMRMEKEDLNQDWLSFLREIHNMIRVETNDDSQAAEILFEVHDIGMDDIDLPRIGGDTSPIEIESGSGDATGALVEDWMGGENDANDGNGLIDQIERLRAIEEAKAMRTVAVREFLEELFARIDAKSKAENNDAFRRSLNDPHHAMPHDEALRWFARLFDAASGDRAWIGKQDADKRRYRELARGRLELLLGDYRMR